MFFFHYILVDLNAFGENPYYDHNYTDPNIPPTNIFDQSQSSNAATDQHTFNQYQSGNKFIIFIVTFRSVRNNRESLFQLFTRWRLSILNVSFFHQHIHSIDLHFINKSVSIKYTRNGILL